MQQDITQKVYANDGNKDVLGLIPPKKNLSILDVGCGRGDNASFLFRQGHLVDGVTLSNEEADTARNFCKQVYIYNLEHGLPVEVKAHQYDVVICSHVLEHICYPETLLNDIKSILKSDGIFIIALPNLMNYKSRLKLLLGNFDYEQSGTWDDTHFRWYTFRTGKELLIRSGFSIVLADVNGDIPFLTIFKWIPIKFRQYLFKGLKTISRGFFGGQLIYVAENKKVN